MAVFLSNVSARCIRTLTLLPLLALTASAFPADPLITLDVTIAEDGIPVFTSDGIELPIVAQQGSQFTFSAEDLVELDGQTDFAIGGFVVINEAVGIGGRLMAPTITFANTSDHTLEYKLTVRWTTEYLGGANWAASSAWHLITPGTLFTLPGQPLWAASVDGLVIDTLFDDPSGIGGQAEGDVIVTSDPISGQSAPIMISLAAELAFSLTPATSADQDGIILLTPCVSCDGDLDCDNAVDASDLLLLLGSWDACSCPADFDGNGVVDLLDLLTLLSGWGDCGE